MNSLRVARTLLRAKPTTSIVARRTYAEAAGPSDKIRLSLTMPHQAVYKAQDVIQVNIPAESGDMGILANHVASVEQLRPGIIDIIEDGAATKQFFLSGGFAVVQPGSQLSINAVEAYPLEDFSSEAVQAQLAEARRVAGGTGAETDIAEAKIEIEVLESLQASLK